MLPKAGQVINIIEVYLPMESITSDGFPIKEQKWNVPVSCEEAMRITAATNVAVSVAFQVTGLDSYQSFYTSKVKIEL